ncbi:ATP-grasp domain-containing protein [Cupriavidus basilensis]
MHDGGVEINAIECKGQAGRLLADVAECVVAGMPGLRGFVGIDLVWHPRRGPVVIEVNPRVTCAYAGLVGRAWPQPGLRDTGGGTRSWRSGRSPLERPWPLSALFFGWDLGGANIKATRLEDGIAVDIARVGLPLVAGPATAGRCAGAGARALARLRACRARGHHDRRNG